MVPVNVWRVIMAVLAFMAVLGSLDHAASYVAALHDRRELLSTLLTAAIIAAFPWVSPILLPLLALNPLRRRGSAAHTRIAPLLERVLPPDIRKPRIMVLRVPSLAAIAVGTGSRSVIFVTTDLLAKVDDDVLQAVLAHELGHLRASHSIATSSFIATLFVLKAFFAFPLVLVLLVFLAYLWGMRTAEFQADRYATVLVGTDRVSQMLTKLSTLVDEPLTSPSAWSVKLRTLLSTHPSYAARLQALG